jgi:hypothetical protein
MSSKITMQLQSALIATGLVQPVSEKARGGYVEILCRQVPGQERPWLQVVDKLLMLAQETGQEFHICRRYVLKNGQMVFGWHLAFECKNVKTLQSVVDSVVKNVLEQSRPSLHEPEPARQEPAVVSQAASRAPLAPGRHPANRAAVPRAPGEPGTVVGTPPATVGLTVVQNFRDEHGKVTIVEEMALPHVYEEMNRPNSKGRGAKLTGGG